jgi:hypothetical protein
VSSLTLAATAPQYGPSTRFGRPLTTHGTSTTGSDHLAPIRPRLRARTVWWFRPVPTLSRLLPAATPDPGSGLPPASTSHCDDRRWVSHHTPSFAPRGAQPTSSTTSSG